MPHNPPPTAPSPRPAESAPHADPNTGRFKRMLLALGGTIAVGLAFLGAALPLLPTAPFVLLAGFCFAKSWPRADKWLHGHSVFGPFRRMRPGEATMTRRFKAITIAVVLVSFGSTLWMARPALPIALALIATCLLLVWFLARQPTVSD